MSLTAKKKIFLKIVRVPKESRALFDALKDTIALHGGRYLPEDRGYIISPKKFPSVRSELENLDSVEVDSDTEFEIEGLCDLEPRIKKYEHTLTLADLKIQPHKGKAPHENYQWEDLVSLITRNSFGLYDDPGCGKSWMLINAIQYYRNLGVKKVIFLTSNSGVYNIYKEFKKFSNIDYAHIIVGDKDNREPFKDGIDIIISNYRSLLLIHDHYIKKPKISAKTGRVLKAPARVTKNPKNTVMPIVEWLDGDKGILILDESHNIANPSSRQSKVIDAIKEHFEYRYSASGTPADKEEKYYAQLRLLDDYLVKGLSPTEWLNLYSSEGKFGKRIWDKPERLRELVYLVKQNSVRRLASEVLDLPENFEQVILVPFNSIQKRIYQSVIMHWAKGRESQALATAEIVKEFRSSFPYLISSLDYPPLLMNSSDKLTPEIISLINKFNFIKSHSKLDAVKDILDKHDGNKIIIWTSHPRVNAELCELLSSYEPYSISGETKVPKGMTLDKYKEHLKDQFEADPKRNILIAGIQVLNSSITITKANVQIYFDLNYDFTQIDQSGKRIHRISQLQKVFTYFLLIDGSLDVFRYQSYRDKEFISKFFGDDPYIDQRKLRELFNKEYTDV